MPSTWTRLGSRPASIVTSSDAGSNPLPVSRTVKRSTGSLPYSTLEASFTVGGVASFAHTRSR